MLVFHVHTLYLKIEYRTGSRLTIGRRSVYLLPQDLCWLFTLSCSASFTSALAEWRNRFLLLLTLHTSLIPAVNGCFAIICRYHSGADIRIGLRCSRLICEPCAVCGQQVKAHCFLHSRVESSDLHPYCSAWHTSGNVLNPLTLLNISNIIHI